MTITWTAQSGGAPTSAAWYTIASSADGRKLVAAAYGGSLWRSTDSGLSWTALSGAPVGGWNSVASSSDGTTLAAVIFMNNIWLSTNSGTTWTGQTGGAPADASWQAIASSSDGTNLVAVANGGNIWLSTNSGTTWTQQAGGAPTSAAWSAVVSSADGTTLATTVNGGNIWLGVEPPTEVVITGVATITDTTDGTGDGLITLTQDVEVEATGDLTLDILRLDDLVGTNTIQVQAGGKLKLTGGQQITVGSGTIYKLIP